MQSLEFIMSLIDRVSAPAGKIMKTMDTVTTNVQSGYQKIGYGAAGLVGVGFAIDRLISKAVAFESTMADVNKSVGFETPKELALFGQDILEMTKTLPLTATGLGEIAAAGGRLGLEKKVLPEFVNLTAKMATAFDMQTEMAGDYAASLSNIYNIPVNKLGELGDVVNHLSDNTAAKASDIVDVLSRVGGVGQQFGLATNQISGLSASMLSLGIPAEQSATSINAMLLRLNNLQMAGPKVQSVLNGMGLDASSFAKSIATDPQAAIDGFLAKVSNMDGAEASMALSTIFGLEHAPKIALLAKSYDKYQDTLGLVANKHAYLGSMEREFQVQAKTTKNMLVLLGNGWDRLMISMGNMLLPHVVNVIGWLNSAMDPVSEKISRWTNLFPNLTKYLGYAVTSIVGLIAGISVLSILVGINKFMMVGWSVAWITMKGLFIASKFALLTMIPAVWGFTTALLANPITWIVLGITALIAALVAAVVYWDVWTGKLVQWGGQFMEFIGLFALVDTVLAAFNKLPEWWTNFKNWLGTLDPFAFVGDSLDWVISKINMIPGINIGDAPEAPKSIEAPESITPNRLSGRRGGALNRISHATQNNQRSIGDIHVHNNGQPIDGQRLMDEIAFAGG